MSWLQSGSKEEKPKKNGKGKKRPKIPVLIAIGVLAFILTSSMVGYFGQSSTTVTRTVTVSQTVVVDYPHSTTFTTTNYTILPQKNVTFTVTTTVTEQETVITFWNTSS